jgi:hypothetical protein
MSPQSGSTRHEEEPVVIAVMNSKLAKERGLDIFLEWKWCDLVQLSGTEIV